MDGSVTKFPTKEQFDAMTGRDMAEYIRRMDDCDELSLCLPQIQKLLLERDEAVSRLKAIVFALARVLGIGERISSAAAFCNSVRREGIDWDEVVDESEATR